MRNLLSLFLVTTLSIPSAFADQMEGESTLSQNSKEAMDIVTQAFELANPQMELASKKIQKGEFDQAVLCKAVVPLSSAIIALKEDSEEQTINQYLAKLKPEAKENILNCHNQDPNKLFLLSEQFSAVLTTALALPELAKMKAQKPEATSEIEALRIQVLGSADQAMSLSL